MGRFTHTPELKTTVNNNEVVKFSLAVGRSKTTADGEKITDFIDCVAWNRTAEFICKHFKKGEPIIGASVLVVGTKKANRLLSIVDLKQDNMMTNRETKEKHLR